MHYKMQRSIKTLEWEYQVFKMHSHLNHLIMVSKIMEWKMLLNVICVYNPNAWKPEAGVFPPVGGKLGICKF